MLDKGRHGGGGSSSCTIPDTEILSPLVLCTCLHHRACHIIQHQDGLLERCLPDQILSPPEQALHCSLCICHHTWSWAHTPDIFVSPHASVIQTLWVQVQAQSLAGWVALSKQLHVTRPQSSPLHHLEVHLQLDLPINRSRGWNAKRNALHFHFI